MNKRVKKFLLMLLYFPFQLVIQICLSPIIIMWTACIRAENQAFEDVYISKMRKRHWWITRFIGFDCLFDD